MYHVSFWRLFTIVGSYLSACLWVLQGERIVDFVFCLFMALLAYLARLLLWIALRNQWILPNMANAFFSDVKGFDIPTKGICIQAAHLLLTFCMWFFLSAAWVAAYSLWQLDHRLPETWEKRDIYVQGKVIDLPKHEQHRQVFFFAPNAFFDCEVNEKSKVKRNYSNAEENQSQGHLESGKHLKSEVFQHCEQIDFSNKRMPERRFSLPLSEVIWMNSIRKLNNAGSPKKIRVSLYQNSRSSQHSGLPIFAGESYQLLLKMRRPRSSLNFEGFDYETWLFAQGIHANAYVKQKIKGKLADNKHSTENASRSWSVDYYREHIRQQLIVLSDQRSEQQSGEEGERSRPLTANKKRPWVKESLALIMALTLGDRSYIQEDTQNTLVSTGTFHLLAISGMHIGLFSLFSFSFSLIFMKSLRWALSILSRQRFDLGISPTLFAGVISSFCAFAYSLLAGFSLPSQRALIMVLCYSFAFTFFKQVRFFNLWLFVLLLVLIWSPLALFSAGLYLSFGAVLLIQWVLIGRYQPQRIKPPAKIFPKKVVSQAAKQFSFNNSASLALWIRRIWLAGLVQLVLFFGLMPWLLLFFHGFYPLALAANIFAIPMVSFLILPMSLLLSMLSLFAESSSSLDAIDALNQFSTWLLGMNELLLGLLMDALRYLQSFQGGESMGESRHVYSLTWHLAVLWTVSVLVIFSPLIKRFKVLLLIPLLAIACGFHLKERQQAKIDMPPQGEFRLEVLDVGQGMALMIETQHHRLIYDTGPAFGAKFDAGSAAVVPAVRARANQENMFSKRSALDLLILSHSDKDHIGGALSVLEAFPKTHVLSYSTENEGGLGQRKVGVNPSKSNAPKHKASNNVRYPITQVKEQLESYKRQKYSEGSLSWQTCRGGETWMWDEVSFEILHPNDDWVSAKGAEAMKGRSSKRYSKNNSSCVLLVKSKNVSLLIPGDIEKHTENLLVGIYTQPKLGQMSDLDENVSGEPQVLHRKQSKLAADILIAPHHGSNSSSKDLFLDAVNPSVVLVSAGFKNQFNHPHPKVLNRYQARGIKILNTAEAGGIRIETWRGSRFEAVPYSELENSNHLEPSLAREYRARFWRF